MLVRFKIFICKYEQLTPIFNKHSIADEIRPFPPDSLASMTPPKLGDQGRYMGTNICFRNTFSPRSDVS